MKANNHYSYTKGKLIIFDGQYGLLQDHYGDLVMFSKADLHMMDIPLMKPGTAVLYNNWMLVESVAGHFHRWNESK